MFGSQHQGRSIARKFVSKFIAEDALPLRLLGESISVGASSSALYVERRTEHNIYMKSVAFSSNLQILDMNFCTAIDSPD